MNVKDSISATMKAVKSKESDDQSTKNIFSYKPIMGNILKYTVSEYKNCSLEEIMEYIEGDTIQTGTALVEEDMAKTIRGEITELNSADEGAATFDILFRSLLPNTDKNILVNLHIDFEIQQNYTPGYPIVKRGVYYASRKLSAQLDKIGKNGKGYKNLEKVYSIWICLKNIPSDLQNTISYYKILNYKNEGTTNPDLEFNAKDADLMEVVIVRLGSDTNEANTLMDLLYGVFGGNTEKVLTYIPDGNTAVRQKEVSGMLNMISYAEENGIKKGEIRGEKRGEKKGETHLATLIDQLLKDGRYEDIEKAVRDEIYREKLYKEYNM